MKINLFTCNLLNITCIYCIETQIRIVNEYILARIEYIKLTQTLSDIHWATREQSLVDIQ